MRYPTKINYFENWSPQMAYILGFTLADGEVSDGMKKGYGLFYDIHPKDVEILNFIRDQISPTRPIHFYTKNDKTTRARGKSTSYNRLSLTSKTLALSVIKLGVKPRKTGKEEMPNVPKKYMPHFVRGFFDGGRKVNWDGDKYRFEIGKKEGAILRDYMYPNQEFGLKRKKALLDEF